MWFDGVCGRVVWCGLIVLCCVGGLECWCGVEGVWLGVVRCD